MRLFGALAAGLAYSFLTPLFIPLLVFLASAQYLVLHGYSWRRAQHVIWRTLDLLDGSGPALVIGICVAAAVSAGFVAARIARDIPYSACLLLVMINITICMIIMRGLGELERTGFLLGGTVCVFFGGYLSERGLRQLTNFLKTRGFFHLRTSQ